MVIAQNFSKPAELLLQEEKIKLDRWKCAWNSDWIADARRTLPAYVHFPFNTSRQGLEKVDWLEVKGVMEETGTPFVNIHLVAFPEEFPEEDCDSLVFDSFVRCLSELAEVFGPDKVIAENVVARANGKLSRVAAVKPDIIARALEVTGCGLLLDTAHLGISCKEQGWDRASVLSEMPLHRLKELHVTGSAVKRNIIMDSMPMTEEDWLLPQLLIDQIRLGKVPSPWLCALEYGGIGDIFEWRSEPDVMVKDNLDLRNLLSQV